MYAYILSKFLYDSGSMVFGVAFAAWHLYSLDMTRLNHGVFVCFISVFCLGLVVVLFRAMAGRPLTAPHGLLLVLVSTLLRTINPTAVRVSL